MFNKNVVKEQGPPSNFWFNEMKNMLVENTVVKKFGLSRTMEKYLHSALGTLKKGLGVPNKYPVLEVLPSSIGS